MYFSCPQRFFLALVFLSILGVPVSSLRAQDKEQPDPALKAKHGSVKLEGNFDPDPHTVNVNAGGPIKSNLGGMDA